MQMTTFTFKQFTFTVRVNLVSGGIEYRDKAHVGGPWSDARKSAANTGLDLKFRRGLKTAIAKLQAGEGDEVTK